MARRLSRFNDYRGWLDTYDEMGEYVKTTPFAFSIIRSQTTTIDPITGNPIQKGDYLIKTEDPIKPVSRRDKVRVEWRGKPYMVGQQTNMPRKGDNSGRRGQLKTVKEFYIE